MSYSFRPATREGVHFIIGGAGGTGSGKTYTLLMLAVGLAYPEATNAAELQAIIEREGKNRIAFIDTERGRGLHYATPPGQKPDPWREGGAWFPFDHANLEPPFSPDAYKGIILAADAQGYRVILVDSFSHEWSGEGGVLEIQEAEFQRLGGRDATKMLSWVKPKQAHKKLVGAMTTLNAHILIALRADQKVKFHQERDEQGNKVGREKIIPVGDLPTRERWQPVCDKDFPFELTLSFVLGPEEPGVPHFLKLQDQHRPFVEMGRPLSLETGRALAAWAGGATAGGGSTSSSTSGGAPAKAKVTPEAWLETYKAGLAECHDAVALMEYQDSQAKTLDALKAKYPDVHKKATDAETARFQAIRDMEDDDQ